MPPMLTQVHMRLTTCQDGGNAVVLLCFRGARVHGIAVQLGRSMAYAYKHVATTSGRTIIYLPEARRYTPYQELHVRSAHRGRCALSTGQGHQGLQSGSHSVPSGGSRPVSM